MIRSYFGIYCHYIYWFYYDLNVCTVCISAMHMLCDWHQMKNEIYGRWMRSCITFIYDTLQYILVQSIATMPEWERHVSKQETIWCNNNIVCIKCWWLLCVFFLSYFLSFNAFVVYILGLVAPANIMSFQIKHFIHASFSLWSEYHDADCI